MPERLQIGAVTVYGTVEEVIADSYRMETGDHVAFAQIHDDPGTVIKTGAQE